MPAVERKYDFNDKTWCKTVDEAIDKERRERAGAVAKRREWYLGKHPDPLVVEPGKMNDNIKYNLAGRAVNKALEFMGEPEKLDLDPDDDTTDDSPQQQSVDDLYELEFAEQFSDLALEGALTGHNFVKLFVDDEGIFRAAVLDPSIMTVCWERGRGFSRRFRGGSVDGCRVFVVVIIIIVRHCYISWVHGKRVGNSVLSI